MRDLIILMSIIIFWFLLGFGLTYAYNDPLIQEELLEKENINNTYLITANTSAYNMTTVIVPNKVTPFSVVGMMGRMFTFRIPTIDIIPVILLILVNFCNWFLLVIFGILLYRLIKSGAG